jgi:hypothetical protein
MSIRAHTRTNNCEHDPCMEFLSLPAGTVDIIIVHHLPFLSSSTCPSPPRPRYRPPQHNPVRTSVLLLLLRHCTRAQRYIWARPWYGIACSIILFQDHIHLHENFLEPWRAGASCPNSKHVDYRFRRAWLANNHRSISIYVMSLLLTFSVLAPTTSKHDVPIRHLLFS